MKKLKLLLTVLILSFTCASCDGCVRPPEPPDNPTVTVTDNDTLPSWIVTVSGFVNNCVTFYSVNLPLDTNKGFSVFPFVVKDTNGSSGLFALVSLKRYDLLFVNQFAVISDNETSVSASYVSNIILKEGFEAMLFVFEPVERDSLIKMEGRFKFATWGLFGSDQMELDTSQSENLVELAKLTLE